MKKILTLILTFAVAITMLSLGGTVVNATTLTITFSTTVCANNNGTININKNTLVADREYEFAFYNADNQILSHPITDNRQWFGLKFSAPNTNYGSVQIDSTNTWYTMKQFGNGSGFFILPLTYDFLGAVKLEIRERATPSNTSGIINIDMSKIASGLPGASPFGSNSPTSTIPAAIMLQTNANKYNPGVVYYYAAGTTSAKYTIEYLENYGAMVLCKGNGGSSLYANLYLTNPSAAYFNIYNTTNDDIRVESCNSAKFNSLTPATPTGATVSAGDTPGTFVINGVLPYTYQAIQTNSATPPADWTGAEDVFGGQGATGEVVKSNSYVHIRTKTGTRIATGSGVVSISLASIPQLQAITASKSVSSIAFTSGAGVQTFTVSTFGNIDASHPITLNISKPAGATWLSVNQSAPSYTSAGDITVTLTAAENTGVARETDLTISFSGDTSYYILPGDINMPVDQAAPALTPPAVTRNVKVLHIYFDPIFQTITKGDGSPMRLHEYPGLGWTSPGAAAQTVAADLNSSSNGLVNYTIEDTIDANEYIRVTDNNQYDEQKTLDLFEYAIQQTGNVQNWWQFAPQMSYNVDYDYYIQTYNLVSRIQSGEIDEVWITPSKPCAVYESFMVGNRAYWINGPAKTGYTCKNFAVVSVSMDRPDTLLECQGHRFETNLDQIFGNRLNNGAPYPSYTSLNMWERFSTTRITHPNNINVGSIHFAPSSEEDYDWANPDTVQSCWRNWQNYPYLTETYQSTNRNDWGGGDPRLHKLWYFSLVPHVGGRDSQGYLNNWWEYFVSMDYATALVFKNASDQTVSTINLGVGNTFNYKAIATYRQLSTKDHATTDKVTVANPAICSASNGVITANSVGSTTVTMKIDGKTATLTVNVT